MTTCLLEATDDHFAWLLGERPAPGGLREPPGGVAERFVLELLRDLAAALHRVGCRGHWLIVDGEEIVGLGGFKYPPDPSGRAEIGYGIAASRRRRGYATRAVALMLEQGPQHGAAVLVAATSISNSASQGVLARNGFARIGARHDPEDGDLILWARACTPGRAGPPTTKW